jgi:hypothetical protein
MTSKYPNLKTVAADDQEPRLASKVLADLPLQLTATIRLRMLTALQIVAWCALGALVLSRRWNKDRWFWVLFLVALVMWLLSYGIVILWPKEMSPTFFGLLYEGLFVPTVACGYLLGFDVLKTVWKAKWGRKGLGLVLIASASAMILFMPLGVTARKGTWLNEVLLLLPLVLVWVILTTESEEETGLSAVVPR